MKLKNMNENGCHGPRSIWVKKTNTVQYARVDALGEYALVNAKTLTGKEENE